MPPKLKQVSRSTSSAKLLRPSAVKGGPLKGHGKSDAVDPHNVDDSDYWTRVRAKLRPDDQLDLDMNTLREDVTRVLTSADPQQPSNLCEFSFKERVFLPIESAVKGVVLLDLEGDIIHKDSEEAKEQLARDSGVPTAGRGKQEEEEEKAESVGSGEGAGEGEEADDEEKEEEEEEEAGDEQGEGEAAEDNAEEDRKESDFDAAEMGKKAKKATNQFNSCERASLTFNNAFRDLETQTYPPPRATFSAQVLQWIIYDAYHEDFEEQQKKQEKDKKELAKVTSGPMKKEETKKKEKVEPDVMTRTLSALKILERMVNQNTFDDIAQDYRYWEDPSDDYRDEEGTLLPLWKFVYDKTKKNNVTALCWNPCYYDLFAVTFGSFDLMKQSEEGAVCLFTLKNPSFPEYTCQCESGVVCVDIHPKHPSLLVIGLYNGNVAVYNTQLQSGAKEPQFKSNAVDKKHGSTVWQVHWGLDMQDGEVNFFSVSADGYVFNWVVMQTELSQTTVISLLLPSDPVPGPDGRNIQLTGCGTTFAFHPTEPLIFLVGTEEGLIYKCSTAYASTYLAAFEAHHMPIHKIDFNKYNPSIYLTCSADWRVKIWEDNRSEPLFVFDLGSSVGDVEWAPYSSTVFAAVTSDGKVHVFDLQINKYKAICIQAVVSRKKNKLTRIAFNQRLPILIIGDDRGCISSLKLSPNLRKKVKPLKKGPTYTPRELEVIKLEKLLSLVREPVSKPPSPDSGSVSS